MGELMMDVSHNRMINYQSAESSTRLMELINKISQCHWDVSRSADGFWETLLVFLSLNTAWKKALAGWAFALAAPESVQRHLLLPVFSQVPLCFPRGSGAAGPDAGGRPGRLLAAFT